jgi:replicative DNA helicase
MTALNYETELTILGHIIQNNKNILECVDLKPAHFEDPTLSQYYTAALTLYKQGKEVDTLSLKIATGLDFSDILLHALSKTSYTNISTAVDQITENYKIKQAKNIISEALQAGITGSSITAIQSNLQNLETLSAPTNLVSSAGALENWLELKANRSLSQKLSLPLQCFVDENVTIDEGWLVTIGARAKMGKSTFALQTALETARQGKKVVFFSLEMSQEEVMDKSLAYLASVSPTVMKNWGAQDNISQVAQEKYSQEFNQAFKKLSEFNFKIYADNVSIWHVEKMIRKEQMSGHIELVVIDQLSFIKTDGQFRRGGKIEEYDFIVRQLKLLARETKTPIILLAQLNREVDKRGDERPKISDLKDCGGIEETSDMILLLYKTETKASVFVTSRHNAGGKFDIAWDNKLAYFTNLKL